MHKSIYLFLVLPLLFFSCEKDAPFEQSPTERASQHIERLRNELIAAPYGWQVMYFPKTDSLLFTNPSVHIKERDYAPKEYGYGGYLFYMSFSPEGTVEMQSDESMATLRAQQSEYEVKQNTVSQVSFTTFNYIHRLVNEQFNGVSDFLYEGKDSLGQLHFRSASYLEVAREYIVFRRLTSKTERDTFLTSAHRHRLFFEAMSNPVLTIRQGDKIFFRSNYRIQHIRGEVAQRHRYHLFMFAKTLSPTGNYPLEMNALGSGYVGTAEGLTFRTGFRYNKNYLFQDFVRQGNKFVCELVRVYDPWARKEKWVSRHLYPQGIPTGVVAEITDEAIVR